METNINTENLTNDQIKDQALETGFIKAENEVVTDPASRKKYHSSARYAASMWHNTVKHVKPPHAGGNFLPLQA